MMNCKKIQELLMTDYIDGELNEKMQASILEHLATCDRCKRFEENLKEKVINPLKTVEKQYPSYFVWENIKNRIMKDRQSVSEKIDVAVTSKLSSIFKTLKPAFAVPAIAIAILVIIFVARPPLMSNGKLDAYIAEQTEFIINLDSSEIDINGLGTSIEEYLLS